MEMQKNTNFWETYYERKIIELGFKEEIPKTLAGKEKLFNNLKSGKNEDRKSTSDQNVDTKLIINSYSKDIEIEYIKRLGWKGHENQTMEQLIELSTAIKNHFRLYKYSYEYELFETPEELTKYSLKELKKINQKFEKKILKLKNKKFKKKQEIDWNEQIITIPQINRIKIKKKIKKFISIDVEKIPYGDLYQLEKIFESLKQFQINTQVSGLQEATLLLLNCEIKSLGGNSQTSIAESRLYIQCLKSTKILKERFPEMSLPINNCYEILKIYAKKIVPDFPENPVFSKELRELWLKNLEESGNQDNFTFSHQTDR
jgi:hypothetical protein